MSMGFGGMFDVMETAFPILFIAVFGFILFTIIMGIRQWVQNNNSPKLTVEARVVNMREDISHSHQVTDATNNTMMHSTSTSYYASFQVESGDRMELHVSGREYGMLAQGDFGKLTFQGTRYLGFERKQEAQ